MTKTYKTYSVRIRHVRYSDDRERIAEEFHRVVVTATNAWDADAAAESKFRREHAVARFDVVVADSRKRVAA